MPEETKALALPEGLISPSDASRLLSELSGHDETLTQEEIKSIRPEIKAADITPLLHEYLKLNTLDILKDSDRKSAINSLNLILNKAPRIHFSFASEPSPEFNSKLSTWLRSNIHPLCLMVIGLVPDVGAGCYVRTTNKVFDFTLKTRLKANKQNLVNRIKAQPKETALQP